MITFPTSEAIPADARVDTTPYAMRYLSDGQVHTWDGEGYDVRSAVCVRKPDGTLERAAARRRLVHGAVQLPAQRDVHDVDPRADHGEHRGVQAPQVRRDADRAALRGVRVGVPARRGERDPGGRPDGDRADHAIGRRRLP